MAAIVPGRPSDRDLLARVTPDMYREAYTAGRTLSAHLEAMSPSEPGERLDAFSRLMRAANIRSASNPEAGIWASTLEEFETAARDLVPEWLARQMRRAQFGRQDTRALYSSADDIPGSLARPYADAPGARVNNRTSAAIPLAEVVAITTPVNGDTVRAYYLTQSATQARLVRVAEGDEIPRAKLTGGTQTVNLKKYGRVLEASYEALRRMRLDKVALYLEELAAYTEIDKVATVLDILVNGDGNVTLTESNLTALDSAATAGTLTLKGWWAFLMLFGEVYTPTTALTTADVGLQLKLLNSGSANVPVAMYGQPMFRDINRSLSNAMALGTTSAAPANKIVVIDRTRAVERYVEIGADIEEVERYSTRQTQTLTITEVEGYAIRDSGAARILDVNE